MGKRTLTDTEKWELARLVNTTEVLLHRYALKQVFAGRSTDVFPPLTPPQVHMVMVIREHGSMTLKQLSQALCVKAPAASAMVDRLVEMGVLTRQENASDRREVSIRLSPRDESQFQEHERHHLQLAAELLDELGDEYARMWGKLCERLKEILSRENTCRQAPRQHEA